MKAETKDSDPAISSAEREEDRDVLFRAKHSTLTFSQFYDQPRVSEISISHFTKKFTDQR